VDHLAAGAEAAVTTTQDLSDTIVIGELEVQDLIRWCAAYMKGARLIVGPPDLLSVFDVDDLHMVK
jgi:hypothetical protein